jgi:hypothetical protein
MLCSEISDGTVDVTLSLKKKKKKELKYFSCWRANCVRDAVSRYGHVT